MRLHRALTVACLFGIGSMPARADSNTIPSCTDPATIKGAIAIADNGYKKRGYTFTVASLDDVSDRGVEDKTRNCSATATLSDGEKLPVTFAIVDDVTGYLLKLVKWGG